MESGLPGPLREIGFSDLSGRMLPVLPIPEIQREAITAENKICNRK